uniref:Uncharacterized protein n=1 Tax=Pipistrellus kuhlii TaxID=59472 RepID=A0A7J7TP93_PIPKU|nr:hypothetical protein mPipKuh1_009303 [Pipistrellus kuhlii]
MCFIPPHYIIPIFPLCWMQSGARMPSFGSNSIWLVGRARGRLVVSLGAVSGSVAWFGYRWTLWVASCFWKPVLAFLCCGEDLTHFYSFVKKGPSKCFMKPALENTQGAGFAFEKAEVSVCEQETWCWEDGSTRVHGHLSMNVYSQETGKRPIPCSRLSLPREEAVERETGVSSDLLRSVKPPMPFVSSRSQTWRR